ncbi:MAG: acyl-CoA dehydrogenase [Rhodococcus erythropolis]|jgi:acyl-CoA dehydrogenase|uniref:acyl-CoA dehydrogenase family protein n=1 Tax=Rhodococcus qingshengii TaxID=334542 RepID=UPI00242E2563|nr:MULTISPECIES: acyl-CoA dehydrogenase family protein [Rhodococcus erythropolis group]MDF2894199.1 acyl-CoA dehydrogenase [Rhodococcus erythropolis]MDT9664615.1 acyl-CoA dehydrogenase family protein [Rhodococcus qingshengii]
MDFAHTAKVESLRKKLTQFMQDSVIPSEVTAAEHFRSNPGYWGPPPIMAELKAEARDAGLWNLFLAGDENTSGLTNLEYAPLAELTGWSPLIAPEALNCSAPDTGNMELLHRFGTEAQKVMWLQPLLSGDIRSCFSMTEPDVASSDADNVATRIEDDGNDWVITGRKWWTTAALRPECAVDLVMGVTDPDARKGRRHSIVLVPMDSPGLTVLRSTSVLGYDDRQEGGHGELVFDGVRVPKTNLLGPRGGGFSVAQTRLGPGRIHHCMRLIGMAERAIALMTRRAQERVVFGTPLADKGVVQQWIAEARVNVDAARLLVLRAAWNMDVSGAKAARHDIAAAKIMTPRIVKTVVDNAIQVFGGAGVSQDTTLAMMYSQARFLQIADGPDEVHVRSLARTEMTAEPALSVVR